VYDHLRTASFEECCAAAPFFCDKLQQPDMDDEYQAGLEALLGSVNGARGFFTSWNSDPEFTAADTAPPPPALLSALDKACNAAEPTRFFAQTLLMNIAMPVAAVCAFERDGKANEANVSMRNYKRAAILAGYVSSSGEAGGASLPSALVQEAEAFEKAIEAELSGGASGEKDFAWSYAIGEYDAEQLKAISQAIQLS